MRVGYQRVKASIVKQLQRCWRNYRIPIVWLGLVFTTSLLVIFTRFEGVGAEESIYSLPPLQVHPLPTFLAQWQDSKNAGNYFAQVKATPLGYLVWSEFPLKVYIEPDTDTSEGEVNRRRFQQWENAVLQALEEWKVYLPLVEVEQSELADIVIERSQPPLKAKINRETGLFDISPVRSAQTRYQFYLRPNTPPKLSHRMIVEIGPDRSPESIIAAALHEIGHALGIWGHSPLESDVMYLSAVRNSPHISPRDINTLKKIYQQPTRLGWSLQR
ncbi:MAG: matrixin family metalloprotease [Prochloraceae cyanobacterium]